ncbi:hypothetical protein E5288_WYG000825 [Bos mutus]|uniref:Uncharacterized protein n=1 Tax=Bos mutus TaxID=72004 RepID=A0A6B0RQ14_9CETA|nr:hypothetical protein [Bos mutus]
MVTVRGRGSSAPGVSISATAPPPPPGGSGLGLERPSDLSVPGPGGQAGRDGQGYSAYSPASGPLYQDIFLIWTNPRVLAGSVAAPVQWLLERILRQEMRAVNLHFIAKATSSNVPTGD